MIGRRIPKKKMKALLHSDKAEFLAVTGRRRVGKTYLIDQVYRKEICFRVTGIQMGSMKDQLFNFTSKLLEYSGEYIISPDNWQEAFLILKRYLLSIKGSSKKVIFIDELPWIHTANSRFLQMLAHFWNDFLSKEKRFVLVICGSATSWIKQKVVNDTGGLHNRLSEIIELQPFDLIETKAFLRSNNIRLTHTELAKIYMTFGGVPFYLEKLKRGESASAAIERLCFSDEGSLKHEYDNLYKALFIKPEKHEAIVRVLANAKDGLTRSQISKKSRVKLGGPMDRAMDDLLWSGFVSSRPPFGKKTRGSIYVLQDEFSVFYHKFMRPNKRYSKGIWLQLSSSQSYRIWLGYAFESLCFKHIDKIKESLGISGVYTLVSSYRVVGNEKTKGFQIDMIIDRKDDTINLCEMKYYDGEFTITKSYASDLLRRKRAFITLTGTRKQVFTTLISSHGICSNKHSLEVVDAEVLLKDLIR